ncbi:MAG: glycerol-3-phosphate dehydrogenase/oxidase [Thermoplasmataceae archaeon]
MKEFSFKTRDKDFEGLEEINFDVLVVGGGITGAGVANILAANGISTILLEKSDFGSGTSQGSSKLIHGGLRYLQDYNFRLVRQLLKERNYILANVGDAKKINFNILIGKNSWKKSEIRLGLILYNLLGGKLKIPKFVENKGTYPEQFTGYFQYQDGLCDDARLVIYNIVSAHENGAVCLNYAELKQIVRSGNEFSAVIENKITGKSLKTKAKIIINCAGPWAMDVAMLMNSAPNLPFKLSKGIHIVVSRRKFQLDSGIAFMSHIDKRQMFIIPVGEVIIIGTTDIIISDPEDFAVGKDEINYILESASTILQGLTSKDIITEFSGIRPLIGNAEDPGKLPRDFVISEDGNIINVFGGKLTNFRAASRNVAKLVSARLNVKIRTKGMPVIAYQRHESADKFAHEIKYECAIFPEDIMRRREAFQIYREDMGKSEEKAVKKAFKEARN